MFSLELLKDIINNLIIIKQKVKDYLNIITFSISSQLLDSFEDIPWGHLTSPLHQLTPSAPPIKQYIYGGIFKIKPLFCDIKKYIY